MHPTIRTAPSRSRVAVFPHTAQQEARLARAAELFWATFIVSVGLLAIAVAGFAGPEAQTSARELLLAPAQAIEQGWDLVRRIDWSYGLRRSF